MRPENSLSEYVPYIKMVDLKKEDDRVDNLFCRLSVRLVLLLYLLHVIFNFSMSQPLKYLENAYARVRNENLLFYEKTKKITFEAGVSGPFYMVSMSNIYTNMPTFFLNVQRNITKNEPRV